jgi:hypothetical protein
VDEVEADQLLQGGFKAEKKRNFMALSPYLSVLIAGIG